LACADRRAADFVSLLMVFLLLPLDYAEQQ